MSRFNYLRLKQTPGKGGAVCLQVINALSVCDGGGERSQAFRTGVRAAGGRGGGGGSCVRESLSNTASQSPNICLEHEKKCILFIWRTIKMFAITPSTVTG